MSTTTQKQVSMASSRYARAQRSMWALIIALFGLTGSAVAQGTLAPVAQQVFLDASGNPINNGKICTYAAGGSTPLATYSDQALTTLNANPIRTNSAGRPTTGGVYLTASTYRILVLTAGSDATCSTGTTVYDQDNVPSVPATALGLDVTGTAGEALAAGAVAYLSDGSGSLSAGRWYQADADLFYGSIHPQIGIATAAIASGATGTIRVGGAVTGLSGLTAGVTYYVSGTAAALTATAPTNARTVGQALSTTSLMMNVGPAWLVDAGQALGIADGRLTLTTALPVTTADVTAGTIFYTPYKGNRIALFDGTRWKSYGFTQLSLALTCTAANMYDIWIYDNAGTLTLETLIWTNATTRATALAFQDGIYVKSGATTRRYMGLFYCTATNQTSDSLALRHLQNYYNRVPRQMRVTEAANSWTAGTSFAQANGSTANQLDFVVGVAGETPLEAMVVGTCTADTAGDRIVTGIGLDAVNAAVTGSVYGDANVDTASYRKTMVATYRANVAVGRHIATWIDFGTATTTCFGDNGATDGPQTGISGEMEM